MRGESLKLIQINVLLKKFSKCGETYSKRGETEIYLRGEQRRCSNLHKSTSCCSHTSLMNMNQVILKRKMLANSTFHHFLVYQCPLMLSLAYKKKLPIIRQSPSSTQILNIKSPYKNLLESGLSWLDQNNRFYKFQLVPLNNVTFIRNIITSR